MQRTPVFYIKTILLVIGLACLLTSAFMPITTTTTYVGSNTSLFDNYEYLEKKQIHEYTRGFESFYWHTITIATSIIFAIGYFKTNTLNVILVFIFTPLFGTIILFFTRFGKYIFTPLKGPVKITNFENEYSFALIGGFLVAIATCISVLRKRDLTKTNDTLLDD